PPAPERIPPESLEHRLEGPSLDSEARPAPVDGLGRQLYVAISRARSRVVLCYPSVNDRGAALLPVAPLEQARAALRADWEDKQEELFGPAETLHSSYRLLRDEPLEGTLGAGGRRSELRFETGLDAFHAVRRQ